MRQGRKIYLPEDIIRIRLDEISGQNDVDDSGSKAIDTDIDANITSTKDNSKSDLEQEIVNKQVIETPKKSELISSLKQKSDRANKEISVQKSEASVILDNESNKVYKQEGLSESQASLSESQASLSESQASSTNKYIKLTSDAHKTSLIPILITIVIVITIVTVSMIFYNININKEIISVEDQALKSMITKLVDSSYEVGTINSDITKDTLDELGIARNKLLSCVIAVRQSEDINYIIAIFKPSVNYNSKCMDSLINYKSNLLKNIEEAEDSNTENYILASNMEIQADSGYAIVILTDNIPSMLKSIQTDLYNYNYGQYDYKE